MSATSRVLWGRWADPAPGEGTGPLVGVGCYAAD